MLWSYVTVLRAGDEFAEREQCRERAAAQRSKGFSKADAVTGVSFCLNVAVIAYAFTLLVGQLWVSAVASRHQR